MEMSPTLTHTPHWAESAIAVGAFIFISSRLVCGVLPGNGEWSSHSIHEPRTLHFAGVRQFGCVGPTEVAVLHEPRTASSGFSTTRFTSGFT